MDKIDLFLLTYLYGWALGIGGPVLLLTWYFERKNK